MPNKFEKIEITFPLEFRATEKLRELADLRGETLNAMLLHIIDSAMREHNMTLYDYAIKQKGSQTIRKTEPLQVISISLTLDENVALVDNINATESYTPSDYFAQMLDNTDKYKLRAAYRKYLDAEKKNKKNKTKRDKSISLWLDESRFKRYERIAQTALGVDIKTLFLVALYL